MSNPSSPTDPNMTTSDNNKTEFNMDIDDAREIQEIQEGFFLEKITDDDIERACLMKTHAREQLYG